jgi:uncharacterized protein (TIGR02996 family)
MATATTANRTRTAARKKNSAFAAEEEQLLSSLTEPNALAVYADWLEERSQPERAAIVRLEDRILTRALESEAAQAKTKNVWGNTRTSQLKPLKLTTTERGIIDDGVELMRMYLALETKDKSVGAWAERLSERYPLIDTYWFGVESDKTRKGVHFKKKAKPWLTTQQKEEEAKANKKKSSSSSDADDRPSAWVVSSTLTTRVMNYLSGTTGYSNAVWRQLGPVLTLNFNEGYAWYVAILFSPTRIYGMAHNRNDHKWTWRVARITKDEYERDDHAEGSE